MTEPQAPAAPSGVTVPPHAIIPEKGVQPRVRDDRRKEPRYPAKHDRANLGWYAGESYQTLAGQLEDVSSNGASLVLDEGTWQGGDVWICLSGGARTEWVRAEVVGATQIAGCSQRVRLRFHESCPFDFFKTAAWGNPNRSGPRSEPVPGARTDTQGAGQGSQVPCASGETLAVDFRELRVAVTMYRSPRAADEPRTGRARDDERGDRVLLLPKACVAVIQLVAALLIGALVIIKLVGTWRLAALLGFDEPRV